MKVGIDTDSKSPYFPTTDNTITLTNILQFSVLNSHQLHLRIARELVLFFIFCYKLKYNTEKILNKKKIRENII